jgi:poly-gamma-glutamate capsule biosynthesis protein CapA/YwtB (metallophosphatase superfamily)
MINACEANFGLIDGFNREEKAGYAWINDPRIDKTILRLRRECDILLVFSHAGLEHYWIPQKEWRARYRHFCDLGADVIIGSHPHVPQAYESHAGSLIFYSLGNFFSTRSTIPTRKTAHSESSWSYPKIDLSDSAWFTII